MWCIFQLLVGTLVLGACAAMKAVQLPQGHRAMKKPKLSHVERPLGEALELHLERCLASTHLLLLASTPPPHPTSSCSHLVLQMLQRY